jgi:type II secretory pathway predicted ATPase ExeA
MVLREIAFELSKIKPARSEACLNIIGDEMAKNRRLVIVDEADLLTLQILEMLRNVNERYACPILLIGEDELKGKLASRRRIASRIRRKLEFTPVTQGDIVYFFKESLNVKLAGDVASIIHHHSKGDWRPVLTDTIGIERAMKASGITEVTAELAREVIKN